MTIEVLMMFCSIILLLISGYQNAKKRSGWTYSLFIIGMSLFFHAGSIILSDDLSRSAKGLAMFLGFVICICIFGLTTYIYNDEKSRTIDDRN